VSLACTGGSLDQHDIVLRHVSYRLQYFNLGEIEVFSVPLYEISHPLG